MNCFTIANIVRYCQAFTSAVGAISQCSAWASFVAQLTVRPYTALKLLGSNDPIGVTLTDPTIVASIAAALRTSTLYGPVSSNGRSWKVGPCGSGYELSANGDTCQCSAGYILRPCIGSSNANWGGINGVTCSAATQTITLVFQY